MDPKELKEILQILDERNIAEFELEEEGLKLRVKKNIPQPVQAVSVVKEALGATTPVTASAEPQIAAPAAVPQAAPAPAAAQAAPSAESVAAAEGWVIVPSPMVGTFYRAPDPNSPPFVNVGDRVRVGQVLCIVEAMKLMNEIEAEVAGEVVKIHQENGQPVQYGAPLFSIRAER